MDVPIKSGDSIGRTVFEIFEEQILRRTNMANPIPTVENAASDGFADVYLVNRLSENHTTYICTGYVYARITKFPTVVGDNSWASCSKFKLALTTLPYTKRQCHSFHHVLLLQESRRLQNKTAQCTKSLKLQLNMPT